MRISKFAKKYQTTQSTIRHYVKRALLTPDRENGQYVFNERCDQQMERIMALKSCHFSLDEIFLILSYETLSELKINYLKPKNFLSIKIINYLSKKEGGFKCTIFSAKFSVKHSLS